MPEFADPLVRITATPARWGAPTAPMNRTKGSPLKLKLAISIILASLAVVAATASPASSTVGYTCKYRFTGAGTSVVIDGYDNGRAFCRAFNRGAKAQRFYGPTRGLLACRFEAKVMDVRLSIYARSRDIGFLFCTMMKGSIGRQFVRTR
jgi:hypothetical protein